jgi:2-polyprenyl-6-methoxyphenol hydroxylase-like FAD-dependent oxidoreductase
VTETVLVIGAGIGGLCAALSLSPSGRSITLLERDGMPPAGDAEEAFEGWRRVGASHVRQSHAFLARLRNIIKTKHPKLLEDLKAAGVRELTFDMMMTEEQQAGYRPEPEDSDLTIITSRRTTLELVMRRYVEALPNVTIRAGFKVGRLLTEPTPEGAVRVTGVAGSASEEPLTLTADVIVDASGKNGTIIRQLTEQGANIVEEEETAGILYFTRHYRLRPGQEEPSRADHPPASGDLGFIKFGVFPGDNGCFSITLAVPEVENVLRKRVMDEDIFHDITLQLPGLQPWTNSVRSEARGKVYGMGDLHSRWRDMLPDGKPVAEGYFALGDTLVRTNPLYGRGCSFAAVSAEALARALDGSRDPAVRQVSYLSAIRRELRPFYDNQLKQDRSAIKRARGALTPGYIRTRRARMLESFFEDGVRIAVRRDVALLREAMRGFHMLEHPDKWLARPRNLAKVIYCWSRGKRRNASAYPPVSGPGRDVMFRTLGLDADADRLASA